MVLFLEEFSVRAEKVVRIPGRLTVVRSLGPVIAQQGKSTNKGHRHLDLTLPSNSETETQRRLYLLSPLHTPVFLIIEFYQQNMGESSSSWGDQKDLLFGKIFQLISLHPRIETVLIWEASPTFVTKVTKTLVGQEWHSEAVGCTNRQLVIPTKIWMLLIGHCD